VPADAIAGTLLNMALVAGAYLALFALAELIRARLRVDGEVTRPLVHAASGFLALALPLLFIESWPIVVLGLGFVVLMVGSNALGRLRSIHEIGRPTAGAFVYPLGIAVAFVGTRGGWPAYPVAVLALAVADAGGGVVGRRFGSHPFRVFGSLRTVEGSVTTFALAVFVTAAVLLSRDAGLAPAAGLAVIVGLVVLVVEALSPRGIDNLTIPAAVVALFATPLAAWLGA
jgi:phytol kinase